MSEFNGGKEYEERADFIEDEDLERWTVDSKFFKGVQDNILQQGAKLIVGPRGTGKTHQMRLAYRKCQREEKRPLAIYTSFSKYYHLEPFLFESPNAMHIFHTWILCKILSGCHQLLSDLTKDHLREIIPYRRDELEQFISQSEKGVITDRHDKLIENITIKMTADVIENLTSELNRKRSILLLDDAALTLTPDYLTEFFEVFRSIKTKIISPKASVYPGTTQYGPRFHVGQDAQEVNAWAFVEDESYRIFTDVLLKKRLPESTRSIPEHIVELFKYASFGVPRAFINLIRSYSSVEGKTAQQKFNKVIEDQARFIQEEYLSLSRKMPQYRSIIHAGYKLFEEVTSIVAEENKGKFRTHTKQMEIGIQEGNSMQLSRMMRFLIEAGLMYERPQVSHGPGRTYKRYVPHVLFLIKKKAFSYGTGFKSTVDMLKKRNKKHPVRRTFATLLPIKLEALKLDLPPCNSCGAKRLTEDQKFCHNCGRELVGNSVYESCMKIPIGELPMPEWQKAGILEHTDLKCVGDILTAQSPASELRKTPYIGRVRSEKIYDMAHKAIYEMAYKVVEEFLA